MPARLPAARTIAHLLAENRRHYGAQALGMVDAWKIRWLAAARYATLQVPAWNQACVSALGTDAGPLARLLALERSAVADADRVLAGDYRLFGNVIHTGGAFPDWHLDYLSGHRFPVRPYPLYTIEENRGSDIICPWELSRFHFVAPLVSAFRATRDEKYRDAFFATVEDWLRRNPYLFGVNWMCGLDIAIRALNIAIGMIFLGDPEDARGEAVRRLLWAHVVYLQQRDLYKSKRVVNNHHLISAAIQLSLLQLFSGSRVEAWKASARKIVASEAVRQFHRDGGNFESAFAYHQFVLEALALRVLFERSDETSGSARRAGLAGDDARANLRRAFSFVSSYTQAWGEMPQVGDSSDGRVFFHRDYFGWRPTDPTYLADLSATLFPDDDPSRLDRASRAQLFPMSGVGTFVNSHYGVVFTALPVHPSAGGHSHFDQTSVLLRVGRHRVLVDSGTYCYTSDVATRSAFRSGRSHNLVLVSNAEPGLIPRPGVFAVPDFGSSGIDLDAENRPAPEFSAYHDGYRRIGKCGTVTRRVLCLEDRIEILDKVGGTGDASIELVFNFHPDISTRFEVDELVLATNGRELARMRVSPDWLPSIETGAYSAFYGRRCECPRIVFSRTGNLPTEVCTSIQIATRTT